MRTKSVTPKLIVSPQKLLKVLRQTLQCRRERVKYTYQCDIDAYNHGYRNGYEAGYRHRKE